MLAANLVLMIVINVEQVEAGLSIYRILHRHHNTGQKAIYFGERECGSPSHYERLMG